MDIRDLKNEEVPRVDPKKYLEEMFRLQKTLLVGYIGIEGLPQYPIDPNTKANQTLLKDFNARATEELGEAWEYLEEIHSKPLNDDEIITKLYGFNEELGDVKHFLVELLIYSGITAKDIENQMIEDLGDNYNEALGAFQCYMKLDGVHHKELVEVPERFLRGGNISLITHSLGDDSTYSSATPQVFLPLMKASTWDVVYQLNLGRNCLKNKPWKQTGMLTDIPKYKGYLIRAFLEFLVLCTSWGLDDHDIFEIYWKKNCCNVFRQKSKY